MPFPRKVRLRNGANATLRGEVILGADHDQHYLVGTTAEQACELWHPSGRWSDLPHQHPLDIVSGYHGAIPLSAAATAA